MRIFNDVVKVLVRTDSPVPWAVPVSTVDAQGNVLETLWTPPFGNTDPDADEEARASSTSGAKTWPPWWSMPTTSRPSSTAATTGCASKTAAARRSEPLRLRPLLSVERWDKATINWLPVLGANTSDKFMLGAAFYNSLLAPKRLQYLAMPMYSFSRNELNGIGLAPAQRAARKGVRAGSYRRHACSASSATLSLSPASRLVLPHALGYDRLSTSFKLAITSVDDQDRNRTSNILTGDYAVQPRQRPAKLERPTSKLTGCCQRPGSELTIAGRAAAAGPRHLRAVLLRQRSRCRFRLFGGRFLQAVRATRASCMGLSGSPDYRRQTAFLDRQQISHSPDRPAPPDRQPRRRLQSLRARV